MFPVDAPCFCTDLTYPTFIISICQLLLLAAATGLKSILVLPLTNPFNSNFLFEFLNKSNFDFYILLHMFINYYSQENFLPPMDLLVPQVEAPLLHHQRHHAS